MKKFVITFVAVVLTLALQGLVPAAIGQGATMAIIANSHAPAGGAFSWGTVVHHTLCDTGTSATYACTIPSVTAGHALVVYAAEYYSGSGNTSLQFLSSVTATGETFTHCQNQYGVFASTGFSSAADCYFVKSAAGGETSVSTTWTNAGLTGSSVATDVWVDEISYSNGPIYYDSGNATNATSCTSCADPPGVLSGSNDAVIQNANTQSAINSGPSSPYATADIENTNVGAGFTTALSQSSYSEPTWTMNTSADPNLFTMLAFSTNASPQNTLDGFFDYSSCTNGSQVTGTCLGNSTTAGLAGGWGTTGVGAGMIATTSGPASTLPSATTVNGVSKSGTSSLNMQCTTSTTGTNCGSPTLATGNLGNKMSVFFTVETSCPTSVTECGAAGGIFSTLGASDYIETHFHSGEFSLVADTEGFASNPYSYTANTAYRVNLLYTAPTSGGGVTEKMIVCLDSSPGTVVNTQTITSQAVNSTASNVEIGISGEEPTTSGYIYYWRNVLWSNAGAFPSSGCW